MATRDDICQYLNSVLKPEEFADYCPNGLQVQGKSEIRQIISGVTACKALLERAIALKADAILVHHGYFWKNEPAQITDYKYQRLKTLLQHDINLFAYHLPLDAHQVYGNNVQLAQQLQLPLIGPLADKGDEAIVFHGDYEQAIELSALIETIEEQLHREPLVIDADKPIKKIAWCTGGAQNYFHYAIDAGADCFISGEISEHTVHMARERHVHYIAAGHHATERYGVQALGQHLAETFDIQHQFIDIDNPV